MPLTEWSDRRIKAGSDPRGLPDYQGLCKEIAKLRHPACPDVDWRSIERCCLALFNSNGADLQTAAAYALARSHLAGLDGMSEGVEVIATRLRADANAWPYGVSARAGILSGLYGQLQAVLRELEIDTGDLAGLGLLNAKLEQLHLTLLDQTPLPVSTLEGLRQQIAQRTSRIERNAQAVALLAQSAMQRPPSLTPTHTPSPSRRAGTRPTRTQIRPGVKRRRALWIGFLATALISLIVALAPT